MAYVVFDLDGTVIDSSHRHSTKADGSIDLKHWFDNAKPEKIAADSLLPLARSMRQMYEAGHTIIICTARCFQDADYQFLRDNDIPFHKLFSRPGRFVTPDSPEYFDSYYGFIGDGRSDEVIKAEQLTGYFRSLGFASPGDTCVIMWDDNLKVLAKMREIGIVAMDATKANAREKVRLAA